VVVAYLSQKLGFITMGKVPANFHGKKGRSGTKTKQEVINQAAKIIVERVNEGLANSKVNEQLKKKLNFKQVKDLALPIALKGMTEKIGGSGDNGEFIIKWEHKS
jgi:hypothetical protein